MSAAAPGAVLLREVAVEESERPRPGCVSGRFVVHGGRIPIAESVTGVVEVEFHARVDPPTACSTSIDLLGRDERVVAAVVELAGAFERIARGRAGR